MKLVLSLVALAVACQAKKGFGPGEQEWGFAEVRPGAHMFWWMYYTTSKEVTRPEDKPLVLWLQGGPGASSTGYGNFKELGPLDDNLKPRNYTWVKDCNVMFVDNPVGTGFSWVERSSLLTRNNSQIAKDLVAMMKQFYKELPQFEETPVYITSESYGGKMTAEFALEFAREIARGGINANLKGVGLGDSWISPIDSVMTWAPYLLQFGMVDMDGYNKIMASANATKKALDAGKFELATSLWGSTEGVIMGAAEGVDFYNVLTKIESYNMEKNQLKRHPLVMPGARDLTRDFMDNIMNKQVKEALGLPENARWSDSSSAVFSALNGDFMKPVTSVVESLLNTTDIKVFVYSGQLDLIVDTPGTYDWVRRLQWAGKASWDRAPRRALSNNGYIEGFKKESGNFGMYWVNRAGHMVPADNPSAMDAILKLLTNNYQGKNAV